MLAPDDDQPDLMAARGGQVNGLCGAAVPGVLSLVTGLHTGDVPLVVEALDTEPALDDVWEDIAEVSFETDEADLQLRSFQDFIAVSLPGPGTYRARYCAAGLDAAHDGTRMAGEPALDRYLLQLWPAPAASDAVIRSGSRLAEYWHAEARKTPPPPPAPSEEELAEAARWADEQRRLEQQRRQADRDLLRWGGRAPSDRLRAVGGRAPQLARADHELAEALAALDPTEQRRVARWAARRACERAALDDVDWVVPALDALDGGTTLPPPFDNPQQAWATAFPGERRVVVRRSSPTDRRTPLAPAAAAIGAVLAAANPDAARAAIEAVDAASCGYDDRTVFFAEARRSVTTGDPDRT